MRRKFEDLQESFISERNEYYTRYYTRKFVDRLSRWMNGWKENGMKEWEIVRVSIFLKETSVISLKYSIFDVLLLSSWIYGLISEMITTWNKKRDAKKF